LFLAIGRRDRRACNLPPATDFTLQVFRITSFVAKNRCPLFRDKPKTSRLARFPIRWSHLIEKNSRQFKNLEHVLVGKAGPLFRDML
jgi:hypothetical protein